ncbi:MAG: hypothetical protein ACLVEV_06645, partial [Lachnospiraceae bacterium]
MDGLLATVMRTGIRLPFWQRLGKGQLSRRGETGGLYSLPEREQLEQYADAFYGLAKLFQKMPCQKERLGDAQLEGLFEAVRQQVCASCERAQRCWGNDYLRRAGCCMRCFLIWNM